MSHSQSVAQRAPRRRARASRGVSLALLAALAALLGACASLPVDLLELGSGVPQAQGETASPEELRAAEQVASVLVRALRRGEFQALGPALPDASSLQGAFGRSESESRETAEAVVVKLRRHFDSIIVKLRGRAWRVRSLRVEARTHGRGESAYRQADILVSLELGKRRSPTVRLDDCRWLDGGWRIIDGLRWDE